MSWASRIVILVALAWAASGSAATTLFDEYQVIFEAGFNADKPAFVAVNSKAQLESVLVGAHSDEGWKKLLLEKSIDFDKYTLLVAIAGAKPNPAYRVQFGQIRTINDVIVVSIQAIEPGPTCATLQMASHPAAFALIAKSSRTVRFTSSRLIDSCDSHELEH